ncbi:MAG: mannose-6-phosphate isomerase, class I [Leptospiraceae bacterium]|nr:mannose-6-phosphate isomerase, class I [Leptospiraceae bacterium]MDW7976548.1 mannose-6-phosphate isomerase, class I [Leptospiraceae bacterium]
MSQNTFYELIPSVQYYDWGSTDDQSSIRTFLKKKHSHFLTEKPIAEVWKGAHPKNPSHLKDIHDSSRTYNFYQLIQENPSHVLGEDLSFKKEFPFLLKILEAEKPLSIQSHPDKKTAIILHKKDPANYPDSNHKPEIAISLGDFEALCGFRPHEELLNFFYQYPTKELWDQKSEFSLKRIYANLMNADKQKLVALTEEFLSFLSEASPDPIRDQWFIKLYQTFGKDDPGIYSIYLLNYYHLKENEALFLPPNTPHAYLRGSIVECMTNSDNVIRAGLTSKFKDIPTLLATLDYEKKRISPLRPKKTNNISKFYQIPIEEFYLELIHSSDQDFDKTLFYHLKFFPSIITILRGNVKVIMNQKEWSFHEGQILFFPGDLKHQEIILIFSSEAWAFLATTLLNQKTKESLEL